MHVHITSVFQSGQTFYLRNQTVWDSRDFQLKVNVACDLNSANQSYDVDADNATDKPGWNCWRPRDPHTYCSSQLAKFSVSKARSFRHFPSSSTREQAVNKKWDVLALNVFDSLDNMKRLLQPYRTAHRQSPTQRGIITHRFKTGLCQSTIGKSMKSIG